MIALIRVRFNNTPADKVWSDAVMHNWMNPGIQYSLAHFWTRTSFFQADMRYFLFAPVAMDDPRPKTPKDSTERQYLVAKVIAEVTKAFSPDWKIFDQLLICFAQPTDQFGGGEHKVPIAGGEKTIPAAVVDVASPFSNICQEVGHTFLLDHEIDGAGNEYMSPYSSMSSELYGGAQSSFEREKVPALPVGFPRPAPEITAVDTDDMQRVIGPYITPVQFYLKAMGIFIDDRTVYQVPGSFTTAPHSFRLAALDKGIDLWPARHVVLAVLPPAVPNGDTYFLELRRNVSYDAGLTSDGANSAPVALVIHAADISSKAKRVRYVNRVALVASPGDRDYHCFAGHFTVRLNNFAEDFSSCSVTVGGDDFWKYFGVNFDTILTNEIPGGESEWNFGKVSPCFMFPVSIYTYKYHYISSEVVMVASSFGYETPAYQWFLNDQPLNPSDAQITIRSKVRVPHNGELSELHDEDVTVQYRITQNKLNLTFNELFSGIYATVKVIVNESSGEVLQNFYPERTVWTSISVNNVEIEWDQAYKDAQNACEKRLDEINDHYAKSHPHIPQRNPEPDWGISTINLINELVQSNPAAANAAINEVARLGNISKLEVIKKLR